MAEVVSSESTTRSSQVQKDDKHFYTRQYRELHKNDPEFKEKQRKYSLSYRQKRANDPNFLEKQREATRRRRARLREEKAKIINGKDIKGRNIIMSTTI